MALCKLLLASQMVLYVSLGGFFEVLSSLG